MTENSGGVNNFQPNFESCSVESLLSVPMHFIFRETRTGGDRGRGGNGGNNGSGGGATTPKSFIFSKGEVSTLLRVSMLSSELDAILSLTYDALDRSQKCKAYRKYIEEANRDPKLRTSSKVIMSRALLPILTVHSETANVALNHATNEQFGVSRVLNELESCAIDLGKFAEQNHTMADQLECYMAGGGGGQENILANEKRAIAEIEEAVVDRIGDLSVLATKSSSDGDADQIIEDTTTKNTSNNNGGGDNNSSLTAMSDLCESLFPQEEEHRGTTSTTAVSTNGGQFTESQMFAAEALQIMHSNSRGN